MNATNPPHTPENDVPPSSWLEAVIRAAVIEWNANPSKPEGDVSLHLTRSLWPVLQEDRAQVWDECTDAHHRYAVAQGLAFAHPPNPHRDALIPPGGIPTGFVDGDARLDEIEADLTRPIPPEVTA